MNDAEGVRLLSSSEVSEECVRRLKIRLYDAFASSMWRVPENVSSSKSAEQEKQ